MSDDLAVRLLRKVSGLLLFYNNNRWEKMPELTLAQIFLLNEIFELYDIPNVQLSLSELSRRNGFSKSTVCSMLKALKKAGYIEMNMNCTDNRRKEILLTSKAVLVKPDVADFVCSVNKTICAGISDHDMKNMEHSLQRVLENMKNAKGKEAVPAMKDG